MSRPVTVKMPRADSRLSRVLSSPGFQQAGWEFLALNPNVAEFMAPGETPAHVLIRGLLLFSDPARAREQREVLGLPASASRSEIVRALGERLALTPDATAEMLTDVRDSTVADALVGRMEVGEAEVARAKNGGKVAAPRVQPARRPTDDEVRRADILAAMNKHGAPAELRRKPYQPSTSMGTDIALAMWSHGALDNQIDASAPGAVAWAKEGTAADRTKNLIKTMDDREEAEAASEIGAYFEPIEDARSDANPYHPEDAGHDR